MSELVTRLHISPLSPDILSAILGLEISKLAKNVSYHSLQVFPESSYGYVDLPKMEADKIKKKLNGSILKGKKVKVEEARPKKRKHADKETEVLSQGKQEKDLLLTRRTKSKRDESVIPGYELPEKRKVKRGWTEPKTEPVKKRRKDKTEPIGKPQMSSKYTDKEELLFKTKVPKNKSPIHGKPSKGKNSVDSPEVVHEFQKSTTMPSFLRSDKTNKDRTVAYQDGQGWTDEQGSLVEKEGERASKRRKAAKQGIEQEVIAAQQANNPQQHSRNVGEITSEDARESSSERSRNSISRSDSDASKPPHTSTGATVSTMDTDSEETSSSGSSTSDTRSEDESDKSTSDDEKAKKTLKFRTTTPSKLVVHPLEALFKKPAIPASSQPATTSQDNIKPSLEIQTSFSFFDQQQDDDDLPTMPMTPFSSQDLRSRGMRSAAPTPDTAHPSRMSSIFNSDESDGELSEMEGGIGESQLGSTTQLSSTQSQTLQVPKTDFEKQFWEKRGENNRAWKARRRAVLKEKRQRENRARRPKNW